MPRTPEGLKSSIMAAFAGRSPPAADRILGHDAAREDGEWAASLAARGFSNPSPADLCATAEGKLWMFSPESFLYFLPRLMVAILDDPGALGGLATELIDVLTEPSRQDLE